MTKLRRGEPFMFEVNVAPSEGSGRRSFWVHPAARGRGVASAACDLVVEHCFAAYDAGGLGLSRVRIRCAEGNLASQGVIARCGFTPGGRERRALLLGDGSLVDMLCYDMLREERG